MEYAPEESIDGQYLDEIQIHLKNSNARQLRDIIIGDTRLHYHDFERFAISFDEVYLKGTKGEYGTGKRQIFAAENQLTKFIADTHEKSFEEELHLSEMKRIAVYFPCVVFDGKIFEVIVEKGELELKKSRHLILTSQYIPSYSTSEQNFLIDIVHKSYFKNYLKKITRDITSLSETIIKNRNELIKRIEDVEAIL